MNEKLNCFGACSEEKSKMNNCNCPVKETETLQSLQSCVSVSVTELRIGNLVECFGIREVTAIKNHKIKVQHESKNGNFISEWCPIKSLSLSAILLTEEWFLKFGFVVRYFNEDKNKPLMWKVEGNRHIDLYYEIQISAFAFKINNIQYSNPIKYVHQLQNLYYALTGSELQIGNLTEH